MERLTEGASVMIDGREVARRSFELYWRLKKYEDILFDANGKERVSFDRLEELIDAEVGVCSLEEMTHLHETEGLGKCMFQSGKGMTLRKKSVKQDGVEEQGLLLQLPCKAGDFVYTTEYENEKEFIEKKKVDSFEVDENEVTVWLMSIEGKHEVVYLEDFGQCVFLTREEAETALRGWKNEAD